MRKATEKLIAKLHEQDTVRVLFVCLGNICRSPAGQGVLESIVDTSNPSKQWIIDSAGTGNYHIGDLPDRRMRVHAQRRGYNLTHRARQVHSTDFEDFDLIIAMDDSNARRLKALAPTVEDEAKVIPMMEFGTMASRYDYVPDPYYEGSEGFELVLDLLENACANLYERIEKG